METTVNQMFRNRARKYGDRPAVEKKQNGKWETATWNEYYDRSRKVGLGLYSLGVKKGDRVAVFAENRLEWIYTDLGTLGIGGCVVPIYATLPPMEIAYILNNSGARALVLENASFLSRVEPVWKDCPALETVVVMENVPSRDRVLTFQELMEKGAALHRRDPALFENLADAVLPDDLLTFQYTSGTTGLPKGAVLTHKNVMAELRSLDAAEPKYGYEDDHVVGFLPLSHIFERVPVHFYIMYKGITKSYAESMETLLEAIQEKKPTIMFGVPRVHEKIYQKMLMTIREKPAVVRKLFRWAQGVGDEISRLKQKKAPVPFGLKFKYKIAYALVFKKLQEVLGGRIRWFCAAGAPIAREIVSFFNAAGIFVLEGYGLSETTSGVTLSNLDDFFPGSVGRPLPGFDVKIAPDGEILIKGDSVFSGYWQLDEETREAFTKDGYFQTGDVGEFREGRLFITDRKKDLIITAGGKNVAPQKVESLFKNNPLFSQFVVVGEGRKYLTALMTLDPQSALSLAKSHGIVESDPDGLRENPSFLKVVDAIVAENNEQLGRFETIKKYHIIKEDFSIEGGELTVSLKVKRKVIHQKYADVIDGLY